MGEKLPRVARMSHQTVKYFMTKRASAKKAAKRAAADTEEQTETEKKLPHRETTQYSSIAVNEAAKKAEIFSVRKLEKLNLQREILNVMRTQQDLKKFLERKLKNLPKKSSSFKNIQFDKEISEKGFGNSNIFGGESLCC